jgi:hypothetical protein
MSECAHTGCSHRATHYLKAKIAPQGFPISRGMDVVMGLALCEQHAIETDGENLFSVPETRQRIQAALGAVIKGAVPLDFSRVQITPKPFDDEWRAYLACSHGKLS